MVGRRSIWSNDEVIELSKQFVAATDEVWRLQNCDDPECVHFQKIADVGHYRAHRSTRQGIYVCTPSGVLLGSMNTHNVTAVIKMMQTSLEKYRMMKARDRLLADDARIRPRHRWEESYPEDGLSLTMYARDLPESCDPDAESTSAWNQDRVWFSPGEAREFLPDKLSEIRTGQTIKLPDKLVARIARFSIVDTVKGQTSYFSRKDAANSKILVSVSEVDGAQIKLTLKGTTNAESTTSRGRKFPHGIKTNLLGEATYDLDRQRFSHFEIVALGSRWGRTVFNNRRKELKESPVGFVFHLTPADAPLIAPSFLFAYRAEWVKRPRNR